MASSNSLYLNLLLFFIFFLYAFSLPSSCENIDAGNEQLGLRALKSFKETPNGGNVTFECSPSGTCVPCAYSEKVSLFCLFAVCVLLSLCCLRSI
ncbi:hypothetical protein LIER_41940 [Lithospermum erythrorhizon]|uniref:Transmembrane protein n=1 Tax=Lithospermum erythrorhizon TaxID=34254 RepID=A0AAV3RGM8_LITER